MKLLLRGKICGITSGRNLVADDFQSGSAGGCREWWSGDFSGIPKRMQELCEKFHKHLSRCRFRPVIPLSQRLLFRTDTPTPTRQHDREKQRASINTQVNRGPQSGNR
jgi:hypothetical protein